MPDESNETPLCCSFCRKTQHEVKKLVAGPAGTVHICDGCTILNMEILAEDEMPELSPKANLLLREKKMAELMKDLKKIIKRFKKRFGHFTKIIEELSSLESAAESFLLKPHSDEESSDTK